MIDYRPLRLAARDLYRTRQSTPTAFSAALAQLDSDDLLRLLSCWQLYARDTQLRPDDCRSIWFRQSGRGEGKTRSGAEERLDLMEDWGAAYQGIILNKTLGDARKINVHGRDSGLFACARRRGYDLRFVASDRALYHPSGAVAFICTPEEPDGPRGYECNDFWADEISSWRNAVETWDNLMYAWRLPAPGKKRGTVTSTPKPNPITFLLLRSDAYRDRVTVTRGATHDNIANLDPEHVQTLSIYDGTKIGRQESGGELLDSSHATIEQDVIHAFRINTPPELSRRIVSVDPSINTTMQAKRARPPDDAGVAVLGSVSGHAYLLDAYAVASHREWPRRVVESFVRYNCDCVIAEVNQGGAMISDAIKVAADQLSAELKRTIVVPVRSVWQKESKQARAEPVGALYERGSVHHVGVFLGAEKELTGWVPGMDSPNMLDAIVMGVSHLLLEERRPGMDAYFYD